MKQESTHCAHEMCECTLSKSAVSQDGKRYCSRGCADGKGCDHPECGCHAEMKAATTDQARTRRRR